MSAGELIDNGSRTHEPSLRELTAQLDDLKELLIAKHEATKTIMDERDRLYDTRFRAADTAVSAALSAQEKQTTLVFQASEKAIVKAEEAQREYNIRSNEFRGQLDDQAKTLMPRPETLTLFKALEDKIYSVRDEATARANALGKDIADLRESRSEGSGKALGSHAVVAYVIAAASLLIAVLSLLFKSGVL